MLGIDVIAGALIVAWIIRRQLHSRDLQALKTQKAARPRFDADRLVMVMSHELRTPLTSIIGAGEALKESVLDPKQFSYVESSLNAARMMKVLVDEILDYGRIQQNGIPIEQKSFSLEHLLREVESVFGHRAETKGLVLKTLATTDGIFLGDELRIKQILFNLISNAIKFTHVGSIELSVFERTKSLTGESVLEFHVRDTGIGISPEDQKRLFAPFTQANESIERRFGGTGLGLYISRYLAQKMGGDLVIESRLGDGVLAKLHVVLARDSRSRVRAPTTQTGGQCILYVDDSTDLHEIMALYLRDTGATVVGESRAGMALKRLAETRFDLVLCDLGLGDMDGFSFIEAAKTIAPTTPLIVVSGHTDPSWIARAKNLGAVEYVLKPFSRKGIVRSVSQAMSSKTS